MGYAIKKEKEEGGKGEKKVFYVQYFLLSLLPVCAFRFFFLSFFAVFFLSLIFFVWNKRKKMEGEEKKRPSVSDFSL